MKIHQVRYVDVDGKRVSKGSSGAKKVTKQSAKWYGAGITGQGKRRVPLATDKEAAQRVLDNLVRDAERGDARLPDRAAARKSLAEHVDDFEADVALGLTSKGGKRRRVPNGKQAKLVAQQVRDLVTDCGFRYPADLGPDTPAKVARYLAGRRAKKRNATERGISAQSADFYLASARRFVRWLSGRAAVRPDLFDGIPGNDRIHARRDIGPEALARVLEEARNSPDEVRTLSGQDRYHLYLTAFGTGFRAGELAALTPAHFDLAAEPPTVSLGGKVSKNRKRVSQVLHPEVAAVLRAYLPTKPAGKSIWPGKWPKHAARMLRVDLAAAGVPYAVDGVNGKEYADFHALRHTFVSALPASALAQRSSRHWPDTRTRVSPWGCTRTPAARNWSKQLAGCRCPGRPHRPARSPTSTARAWNGLFSVSA